MQVAQNILNHGLGAGIGISAGTEREGFSDWHRRRIAINRGGRAENQILHPVPLHGLAEIERASEIVVVVEQGLLR